MRPRIGITSDLVHDKLSLSRHYTDVVWQAGGLPVALPVLTENGAAAAILDALDGLVLSGGDDPIMEPFGCATHPKAKPLHPDRQQFELALLDAAANRSNVPILGICLGMQMMALHSGGALDQHLPDTLSTHGDHWDRGQHTISGAMGSGVVHSHHRQAVTAPGKMDIVAVSHDNVIEAVRDTNRKYYLGVQWHPERTEDPALSLRLFEDLVRAATR